MNNDSGRLQFLLAMHEYNTTIARQYFDYRERLTASTIIAYAALLAAILSLKFSLLSIPVSIMLSTVAWYSERMIMKFYERSSHHFARAHEINSEIDRLTFGEGGSLTDLYDKALTKHRKEFKIRSNARSTAWALQANTHDEWSRFHKVFLFAGIVACLLSIGIFLLEWESRQTNEMGTTTQSSSTDS